MKKYDVVFYVRTGTCNGPAHLIAPFQFCYIFVDINCCIRQHFEVSITHRIPLINQSATNKAKYKRSVFWITGLKILGRIGTHIFYL